LAIELGLMVTMVEQDLDYLMAIVVDSIAIDFVLVDYFVDVVEQMTYRVMMNYKKSNILFTKIKFKNFYNLLIIWIMLLLSS
jgi:hypothetical protein